MKEKIPIRKRKSFQLEKEKHSNMKKGKLEKRKAFQLKKGKYSNEKNKNIPLRKRKIFQ